MVADLAAARSAGRPGRRRGGRGPRCCSSASGVLTREQVLAEGVPGGFTGIYSELTQLEVLGVARRGYFVEGLGGAQFAVPGAVERLRERRGDHGAGARAERGRSRPAVRRGAAVAQARGRQEPGARRRRPGRAASAVSRSSTSSAVARGCRRSSRATIRGSTPALERAGAGGSAGRARGGSQARAREGRRRVRDGLAAERAVARPRVPGGPAAADAQCLRATRSCGPRRGCGRCSRGMSSR